MSLLNYARLHMYYWYNKHLSGGVVYGCSWYRHWLVIFCVVEICWQVSCCCFVKGHILSCLSLTECTGTVFCVWPYDGSVSRNMSQSF